jgi:hypothetical protein
MVVELYEEEVYGEGAVDGRGNVEILEGGRLGRREHHY